MFSSWNLTSIGIVLHFTKYEKFKKFDFQSWVEYNKTSDLVNKLGCF